MIYMVFACFCVFFALSLRLLMAARRHDRVLFRLCQLRRDVMEFLYQNTVAEPEALRQYRHTLKQAKPIDLTENAAIQRFHQRFAYCCAKAFLAYTPFIRSESVLRLAMHFYRVRQQQYLLQAAQQVREHRAYGNLSDNVATA